MMKSNRLMSNFARTIITTRASSRLSLISTSVLRKDGAKEASGFKVKFSKTRLVQKKMIPQLSDALEMWEYQAPRPKASILKHQNSKKDKKSKLSVQFDEKLDCTRVIPRLSDADEVWYILFGSWQ